MSITILRVYNFIFIIFLAPSAVSSSVGIAGGSLESTHAGAATTSTTTTLAKSGAVWAQTDLPRLKRGMVGAQFWAAYVPCGAQYLDAVQLTLEQIDVIR